MYLKSIEVQGFKSFAHKLRFEFHNGITGIVGPNGSGKSNVADAVRWVLGEQSAKQLRSSKMEDVIFAGTENRKPQGFAYVAITLDNTDHSLAIEYDEVTVARRVYRSGESEYLINGNTCRLKDVHELFYDTGIGKEGYSIIGQGQIDKILSGKPEERRELFDEAVGIVKYKRRKNAAVKKLEAEKQNLVRIEDILSELEKQVGPLGKQAETAKEYLRLKEELKVYDINSFLVETMLLKEQLKELEDKIFIADNELINAKQEYDASKIRFEKLEEELMAVNAEIEKIRTSSSQNVLLREKLEGEINLLKEQINSATVQDESFNQRIAVIRMHINEKQEESAKHSADRNALNEKLAEAQARQNEAMSKYEVVAMIIREKLAKIEENKNRIIDLLNEKSSVKERLQRYSVMAEQVNIKKSEINRRLIQYKSDEVSKLEYMNGVKAEFNAIEDKIKAIEDSYANTAKNLDELAKQITNLERERLNTQQAYHQSKSRFESLQNIAERYDGYGNSIRQIMELKGRHQGIIGVVADIFSTEKKYEMAMETALGGNIQNIVTDNEKTAKELVEYLKKNKMGRATFLPLDGICVRNNTVDDAVLREQGVLGIASNLIKVDKKYRNVAEFLLGRVIVTDRIENALVLAKKYRYSLRIVTLDGELLNPGGSLTGGFYKHNSNLLGRKRELEELDITVAKLSGRLEDMDRQYEVIRNKNEQLQSELEELRNRLQEQQILRTTAKLNLDRASDEHSAIEEEYNGFINESAELDTQLKDINEQIMILNSKLVDFEKENKELEKSIDELNDETEKDRYTEAELGRVAEAIRMEYSSLSQKESFILENIKRIKREVEQYESDISELKMQQAEAAGDIETKKCNIEEITKTIEAGIKDNSELDNKLVNLTQRRDELNIQQKKELQKREETYEKTGILDKEMYRLTSQKEKIENTLEVGINYMWEEYELTYNTALEFKNDNLGNVTEMKKKASSLKNDIKALGNVNVNAIEDFKEVSERYDFLSVQHDDLITAEQNLLQIIEELDEGMRKQFEEGFKDIRIEFDKAFKELFGGGKGTLELTEEEDILEAGIKIIAQPPGKKLQNMMQLSGGEKALTAIALLFAIQNLKPSPFCLLDEIEAALDENNVIRFAKYLNKLTKNTQFIVITHRRGTMAEADRLYGITMQEKGVSTLVSVNLIEEQLEKEDKKGNHA